MRLWHELKERMLRYPDRTVREGGGVMTYEELVIFAERLAARLTDAYYGILCHSELGAAMAMLACFAAGKPAVPLPVRYGEAYYKKILNRAEPPALLTDFGDGLYPVRLTDAPICAHRMPPETEVVLFTSGSTGVPKGVMLSGENLLTNVRDICGYFPLSREDTILIARPLYHSSVLTGEFLAALWCGAGIVFSSKPFQPQNILTQMREERVTVFGGTPTLLSALARFVKGKKGLTIRLLTVSGECMTDGMAKAIRSGFPDAAVYCGYGLSEASPRVAYLPPELFDVCPTVTGLPLANVQVRLMRNGKPIWRETETGELWVRGKNVMLGYFDDPARTEAVLQDGWLRTGDIALWNQDGLLTVRGRCDDMILRAGMNIYPAEVENALSGDPRVRDVLVYGFSRNGTQEIGLKICGSFADVDAVMRLCRERLPAFQLPARVELVPDTEMLCGGKKNRRKKTDEENGT